MTDFKYCYGPVGSWRLGASLGIDPVSRAEKVCSFDCIYCQLGTHFPEPPVRRKYVLPKEVGEELEAITAPADYLTFSGRGEPTLAANLKELLLECGRHRTEKTAIITNASLIYSEKVREELSSFDFVLAKLDAPDPELFNTINRPAPGISFEEVVKGLILFSKRRRGRLAVQTMVLECNKTRAPDFAAVYARISPDEVQLNTPLRPCPEKPVTPEEMAVFSAEIKNELEAVGASGIKVITVYEQKAPRVDPVSAPDTLKRRGKI